MTTVTTGQDGLRIGVDAKWYFRGPASGQMVVQNVVRHLPLESTPHHFYVFVDREFASEPLPIAHPRLHRVDVWAGNNLLANVMVLPRVARQLRLDVLVAQTFSPFASKCRRVAVVHDVLFKSHPQFYTLTERLYLSPLRLLSRRAHRVCTVSMVERNRLVERGYALPAQVDVVYHGVDPIFRPAAEQKPAQLARVRTELRLPSEYLLFVGRLNVRKNVAAVLRAFASLTQPGLELVVVGGADWKTSDLRPLLRELGIAGRVRFTGPLAGDTLAAVVAQAKVFCFPSFAESFGLPPLEAMACGIPVVVADNTSMPEVCGSAGTYVPAEDHVALTYAIARLLDDPELYAQKRALGLERSASFQWARATRELVASAERACAPEIT